MPTKKDIALLAVAALLIGLFIGVMLPVGPSQVQAPQQDVKTVSL